MGLDAVLEGDSRLEEVLNDGQLDEACTLLQDSIAVGKEANCWLTQNSGVATPYGRTGTPAGGTVTVHHLVIVDADAWTVTLDVWARGGAA